MNNRYQVRLNVCKSWNCPNLGVADAPDYVWPVYRLGYPALGCGKCGSLPPLFNEAECNAWFQQLFAAQLGLTGQGCPRGCRGNMIRYGANRSGNARRQCSVCKKVFTPWQATPVATARISALLAALDAGTHTGQTPSYRVLQQAATLCQPDVAGPVARIATQCLMLPFQGERRDQRLYAIVSADADSGNILQVSTNYSPWSAGESLCYRDGTPPVAGDPAAPLVERVRAQEALFLARRQFDDIRYGDARLKRNDSGVMVRPVIALHGHFQRLHRRFHNVTDHYLAHECVLRGAAITAWAADVQAGRTRLWFVVQEGEAAAGGPFILRGSWRLGWWNNQWQLWENATARKMIAPLTGNASGCDPQQITLKACNAFTDWLANHPWSNVAARYSARVISQQLICLAGRYNQMMQKVSRSEAVG